MGSRASGCKKEGDRLPYTRDLCTLFCPFPDPDQLNRTIFDEYRTVFALNRTVFAIFRTVFLAFRTDLSPPLMRQVDEFETAVVTAF